MANRLHTYSHWATLALVLILSGWSFTHLVSVVGQERAVYAAADFKSGFGGTDWVVWENSDNGVVATEVHPLIELNAAYGSDYIQPGDILRRIDQEDVYDAEVPRQITLHADPGTILMYQIERKAAAQGQGEWRNLLIPVSFQPRFSFLTYVGLWLAYPWVLIAGVFISLVSLLILFPILRPNLRDHWPILLLVFSCLFLFFILGLRHANLLVRTEYVKTNLETVFMLTMVVALPLYGCISLLSVLKGKSRWGILPMAGINLAVIFTAFGAVNDLELAAAGPLLERTTLLLFSLQVTAMLALSILTQWSSRSRVDRSFHLLGTAYGLGLSGLLLCGLLGIETHWSGEPATFLSTMAILLPLVSVGASQLKFGRVSLVLTSSLQYVLMAAISLFLFYIIEFILSWLGLQFRYQIYLELSLLLFLIFFLRAIWKTYESRWRRYFILAQQERRERIGEFTARVPQYTSSRKLLEDLVEALKQYFETSFVSVQLRNESPAGDRLEMPQDVQEELCRRLSESSAIWLKNRQVTASLLPKKLEDALATTQAAAAFPMTVNEEIFGLLFLGPKRRGVYNLDDIEVLSRLIQQTRLTLGVLHLLEREKLLLEKNYEANLTALRSQINPHFLFNTLNTISALIHDDPDGAEKAVEKLAFIFRYTLKHSDKAAVTLKEELSLVRTYLEIEQIRFGKRLNLSFDLDPGLMEIELPAFVIQTIVENCIKHGIARITGSGKVEIRLFSENGFAVCEVFDNGPGIDLSRVRSSTGLDNILTRMSRIYGREDLLLFENTGQGTKVTLKLPLPA